MLSDETKNSLVSEVEATQGSVDAGEDQATMNRLNVFINEINAQRGNNVSDEGAGMLIACALNIIARVSA